MTLFRNKYRSESLRLPNWDYGSNGSYFITICTGGMECFFGHIDSGQMFYSHMGIIAHFIWKDIPNQFPYVELDEHIVMPNHVHGIINIDKIGIDQNSGECDGCAMNRVSTKLCISNEIIPGGITENKNPMLHENLSRIIRWYKGRVTFECHKIDPSFYWQGRFYDNIIQNHESYIRIANYIRNNPANWKNDEFYTV